jgi:TonB family protein
MFPILMSVALKSTAILVAAWLCAFLLRKRSAAARHLVWTAAAVAVLALPILIVSLPALRLPIANTTTSILFQAIGSEQTDTQTRGVVTPLGTSAPVGQAQWRPDWKMGITLLWIAGSLLALAQMLLACVAIWRVRRAAKPFGDRELSTELSQALGIRHPVDVLESGTGSMPMTFGILRSAVFMPSDAGAWSQERRRVVLLHELAHVRRGDVATHLLARAALSIYWWNPLAWKAWREFLKERERATDDLVLNAGARASEYAGHLLDVARTMRSAAGMGCAAVAMARRSQLEGRLMTILDAGINRRAPGRAAALVTGLLALAMVAPFAAVQAQDDQTQRQAIPADIDAAIRSGRAQKNYAMLDRAAKAAELLRKYDIAQKLLEAALEIRGEDAGQQSVEYGLGLIDLGDLERMRNQAKAAESFYARASQVLGDRPEAATALVRLGIAALGARDYPQAFDYFQHAQRVDSAQAGAALMWMAVTRERSGNIDEAETFFKQALDLQAPSSLQAAVTMKVYAQFLRNQSRSGEATDLDGRAAAIQNARATKANPKSGEGVYRPGGSVAAPSLLQKVEPEYSEEARMAKLAGSVVVGGEVGPDGFAHNLRIMRGLGLGLDQKAIDAIQQWRFNPGTKDGQPVSVMVNIEVNFRLL